MFVMSVLSCNSVRKIQRIRNGEIEVSMSLPDDSVEEGEEKEQEADIDSIRGTLQEGPMIMNAIRDDQTGEMVATDIISASKVTARFRNVAERNGMVSIGFEISVPGEMAESKWQLKIYPDMYIQSDTVHLDPIFITGSKYRSQQLKGYQRYNAFLAGIITDTTDFLWIRQLEIFLQRNFPDTYAMKTDSSYVSDAVAESLFGVSRAEAVRHYTKHLKWAMNERKKARRSKMFGKYVKDPIQKEGIRLDTVLVQGNGDFVYRYTHSFQSRPRLKKVTISLSGWVYEDGEKLLPLPLTDNLTFYISSLTTLVDDSPKYVMKILLRKVYDNTKAFIDFAQGSSKIDESLGENASELERISRCVDDMLSGDEYSLDSLVVIATCSPEGSYAFNDKLSASRSRSVCLYLEDLYPEQLKGHLKASNIPENWSQLSRIVSHDSLIEDGQRRRMLEIMNSGLSPDAREARLSTLSHYRYLREKVYPKLRTVSFDFFLSRNDLARDTVWTTELDTAYMAGVEALKNLDYKKAVAILRPYDDYNAALSFACAGYDHSAFDVLSRLDDRNANVCYLKSMVLARLGAMEEALKYFELSVAYSPGMEFRANLDPEMYSVIEKWKQQTYYKNQNL